MLKKKLSEMNSFGYSTSKKEVDFENGNAIKSKKDEVEKLQENSPKNLKIYK
jgi:hypothetical protein